MLQNVLAWVQSLGSIGPIVFIGAYILATVLFIPGTVFTLGAGVVFGVVWGSLYVFFGATIGAVAAFLVGRYLARDWVSQKIQGSPKFRAIDEAVAKEGLKIVILTRLSPIFPFILLNYAFGVTQVSLRDYVFGSIGMIPGTIMYVYIGSLAGSLATLGAANQSTTQATQFAQWTIRLVGLIATIAVTLYITRIARTALQQSVGDNGLEDS